MAGLGDLINGDVISAIVGAGSSLAGTYFQLSQNKEIADQQIKQRQDELEAAKAAAAGKGGGGGGGGQGLAIARMNNLSALYQNWAALAEKGGETGADAALGTGKLMTDPLIARASVLGR